VGALAPAGERGEKMSDYWSAEYKAGILDELKTANDANEYLSEQLAAAIARADAVEADAERLAEAANAAIDAIIELEPWWEPDNERAELRKLRAALTAHNALRGDK